MSDLRQVAHGYYLYKNDGKSSYRLVNEIEKNYLEMNIAIYTQIGWVMQHSPCHLLVISN